MRFCYKKKKKQKKLLTSVTTSRSWPDMQPCPIQWQDGYYGKGEFTAVWGVFIKAVPHSLSMTRLNPCDIIQWKEQEFQIHIELKIISHSATYWFCLWASLLISLILNLLTYKMRTIPLNGLFYALGCTLKVHSTLPGSRSCSMDKALFKAFASAVPFGVGVLIPPSCANDRPLNTAVVNLSWNCSLPC